MNAQPSRNLGKALARGAAGHCPRCGLGRLFDGFLALHESCDHCALDIRAHSPAAGPAFLTVAVVGVVLVPVFWVSAALLGPNPAVLALVGSVALPLLAVLLLRVLKGAMVGYLWALGIGNGDRRR